jgi:hypothetical protein
LNRARLGPEAGVLAELADRLDAVVAGAVDLDDVDVLADRDRLADVAALTGLDGRPRAQFRHLARSGRSTSCRTPRVPLNR